VINALPSIAHFSGLGDYFDQPLKTYSTGMRTRLAFAVATEFVQGSLVIDEALSAGDSQFSKQAEVRLNKLLDEDRTVVLVSHSMSAVKNLADSCIWLHEGRVAMQGSTKEVIGAYQAQNM
jgi:ABC-type polysaccharide/polyol phosphate transport system ATPase subunit